MPISPLQDASKANQASGQDDLPYSEFIVILVEYFQQLPTVGDKSMYTEVNVEASLLFNNIQFFLYWNHPINKLETH